MHPLSNVLPEDRNIPGTIGIQSQYLNWIARSQIEDVAPSLKAVLSQIKAPA
jgi:hypothetical protein